MRELGLGDHFLSLSFLETRSQFRIVDLEKNASRFDIIAAMDGDLDDAPVHPSGDVGPNAVRLALDQKGYRPGQKPKAEADHASEHDCDAYRRCSSLSVRPDPLSRHGRNRLVAAVKNLTSIATGFVAMSMVDP